MSEPSPGDTIYFQVGSNTYFGKFERTVLLRKNPYYELISQGILIKIPETMVTDVNSPRKRDDFI